MTSKTQIFRNKQKESNPEAYQEYLAKQRARSQKLRDEQKRRLQEEPQTQAQRDMHEAMRRAKNARTKVNYYKRKVAREGKTKSSVNPVETPKKKPKDMDKEERRLYNNAMRRRQRDARSSQKKTAEKMRRRKKYQELKKTSHQRMSTKTRKNLKSKVIKAEHKNSMEDDILLNESSDVLPAEIPSMIGKSSSKEPARKKKSPANKNKLQKSPCCQKGPSESLTGYLTDTDIDDRISQRPHLVQIDKHSNLHHHSHKHKEQISLLEMEPFPLMMFKNEASSCIDDQSHLALTPIPDVHSQPQCHTIRKVDRFRVLTLNQRKSSPAMIDRPVADAHYSMTPVGRKKKYSDSYSNPSHQINSHPESEREEKQEDDNNLCLFFNYQQSQNGRRIVEIESDYSVYISNPEKKKYIIKIEPIE